MALSGVRRAELESCLKFPNCHQVNPLEGEEPSSEDELKGTVWGGPQPQPRTPQQTCSLVLLDRRLSWGIAAWLPRWGKQTAGASRDPRGPLFDPLTGFHPPVFKAESLNR